MNAIRKRQNLFRTLFGDETQLHRIPVFNTIVMGYVALSATVYVLFLIAPFVTFMAHTPLYHIQSYLGLLGGLLLAFDLFTNKGLWRGPYCVLLYIPCGIAAVSSVMTLSYGVKDNIFILCWTVIQFALFYSCAYRLDTAALRKYLAGLYAVNAGCWLVACCVSVGQYLLQIGYLYVVDPLAEDLSTARQGFIGSRLFGVFNPLNHAVYVSLMLLTVGIYYLLRTKKLWLRIVLSLSNFVFFSHILLSGSRSAELSMLACVFFAVFLLARNRFGGKPLSCVLRSGAAAVLATVLFLGCFTGVKALYSAMPVWMGTVQSEEEEEDLLDRSEELEENGSNNRFDIWGDYFSLYDEIGLLGLSPGNYMSYIREHNPNLFIVQYMRENFPEKFAAGSIYHVHNGYLMAYVSAGILGLLSILAFLVLCCIRAVRYLISHREVSLAYITLCALIGMGCISAMFDKSLFFMDSAPTFLFWIALGILMKSSDRTPDRTALNLR